MEERLWILENLWIGGAILIVLIFVVSALVGLATRDKGKEN